MKKDRAIDGGAICRLDFLVQTSVGSSLGGVTQRIWPSDLASCYQHQRQIQSKADHVITLLDSRDDIWARESSNVMINDVTLMLTKSLGQDPLRHSDER